MADGCDVLATLARISCQKRLRKAPLLPEEGWPKAGVVGATPNKLEATPPLFAELSAY